MLYNCSVSIMASLCPLSAAKEENCAARSFIDICGLFVDT